MPLQTELARGVLNAAAELRGTLQRLGEVSDQIARAGGGLDLSRPATLNTGEHESYARRLLQTGM
jgi:hypothetical protein